MKEKSRLTIVIILFIILFLLIGSLLGDFLRITIEGKVNSTWFNIIHFILIFLSIRILLETKPGKYLTKKLLKKKTK